MSSQEPSTLPQYAPVCIIISGRIVPSEAEIKRRRTHGGKSGQEIGYW